MDKKTQYLTVAIIASVMIFLDIVFFFNTPFFVPVFALSLAISFSVRFIDYYIQSQSVKRLEKRFPDFVRNLVDSVKSGMPISHAIVHVAKLDYGPLNPHVTKLAHQIEWAIPVRKALQNFAKQTKSPVIKRAISTVIEAEQAGGNMEDVLSNITNSVMLIESLKEKRKASVQGQVTQTYIIFFVYLLIMIVVQNLIVPYVSGIEDGGSGISANSALTGKVTFDFSSIYMFIQSLFLYLNSLRGILLVLTIIQGFFTGVMLGKMAEGDIRAGFKHSAIMILIGFIVITFSQGF